MRILVVEDDDSLRRYVRAAIEDGGFGVDEAARLDDATLQVESVPYDAVVLDLGLPDGDGLRLIETVRRVRASLPVLILTARDSVKDRVKGLDAQSSQAASSCWEPLQPRPVPNGRAREVVLQVLWRHRARMRAEQPALQQRDRPVADLQSVALAPLRLGLDDPRAGAERRFGAIGAFAFGGTSTRSATTAARPTASAGSQRATSNSSWRTRR